MAGVEGGATSGEDLVGVDVEELLVEGDAPEVTFAVGGGGGSRGVEEGRCLVGLDLAAGVGAAVECYIARVRRARMSSSFSYVLELWNSRSSLRSVWPRSPCDWDWSAS